jgi:hypothetical protein
VDNSTILVMMSLQPFGSWINCTTFSTLSIKLSAYYYIIARPPRSRGPLLSDIQGGAGPSSNLLSLTIVGRKWSDVAGLATSNGPVYKLEYLIIPAATFIRHSFQTLEPPPPPPPLLASPAAYPPQPAAAMVSGPSSRTPRIPDTLAFRRR